MFMMTVLTHERKHSSVRSGVYKWTQNCERKVKHDTCSAYHEVRIILFLLNLKFCGVITNKCKIYIFSTMETSHYFSSLYSSWSFLIAVTTRIKIRSYINNIFSSTLICFSILHLTFHSKVNCL